MGRIPQGLINVAKVKAVSLVSMMLLERERGEEEGEEEDEKEDGKDGRMEDGKTCLERSRRIGGVEEWRNCEL